jgi:hypothetical protein
VESVPLLELLSRKGVSFFRIPVEHILTEIQVDRLAVLSQDAFGVVEQIISVDDANFRLARFGLDTAVIAASDSWTNETGVLAVVEETAELLIASLAGHERVEASALHERWNAATIIAGNRISRMTDQEGEMELFQDLTRNHGWVPLVHGHTLIRERRAPRRTLRWAVEINGRVLWWCADRDLARGRVSSAYTTLWDVQKRRGELSWLLLRRDNVICDVLDEDTLALGSVSMRSFFIDSSSLRKSGARNDRSTTYLCSLVLDPLKDGSKRRVCKPALLPRLLIILKSSAHALWAIVESIAKWLMNGLKTLTASHENL